MLKIACLCLTIAAAMPLWSQVEPSASGGAFDLDDSHMMTPPPVSGDAYPVIVGSETRSNYFSAGMVFTGAYLDNLMVTRNNGATGDETYSFIPTINLDRRTPRQGESLHYSSGFNLYQNTSQLNGVSQDAEAAYRFHLSPYAVLNFQDSLRQNNNLYNQSNPFAGGGVPTTPGSSNNVLIAPFQNQLSNSTSAALEYQYGRNAMIGGSGSYAILHYSGVSNLPGLDDANSAGGSSFYSRRIARSQYIGATYGFTKTVTHPIDTYSLTNTILGFYTLYFTRSFSLSVLGGPEHYTSWSPTTPKQVAWTPAIQGSFGWQTLRSNVVASYSHVVSSAGGLIGTYHANLALLSARYSITRTMEIGASGNYAMFKNVNTGQSAFAYGAGGHTLSGTVSLGRRISERLNAEAGYEHFHQSYGNIPIAETFPDSNRGYVSIIYQFVKPIGR